MAYLSLSIIFLQYGVEFTAEHVLPLIIPLLTAQQLNVQQFAKYMLFVKDILRYTSELSRPCFQVLIPLQLRTVVFSVCFVYLLVLEQENRGEKGSYSQ